MTIAAPDRTPRAVLGAEPSGRQVAPGKPHAEDNFRSSIQPNDQLLRIGVSCRAFGTNRQQAHQQFHHGQAIDRIDIGHHR